MKRGRRQPGEPDIPEVVAQEYRAAFNELISLRLPSATETVAALLAAATLIAILGTCVLWIRCLSAGIPVSDALSVIPRQTFIVVGAETLLVPTLISTAIIVLLGPVGGAHGKRSGYRAIAGDAERARTEGRDVEEVVLANHEKRMEILEAARRGLKVGTFLLAVGLFLFLPFGVATVASSLAFLGSSIWGERLSRLSLLREGFVVLFVVLLIWVCVEIDSDRDFVRSFVTTTTGDVLDGGLVAQSDQGVFLADEGSLVQVPSRVVDEVTTCSGDVPPESSLACDEVTPAPKSLWTRFWDLM